MNDLIDRQQAINAIEHRLAEPAYQHEGEDWYTGMNCAESELYDLPFAQPEPRWIPCSERLPEVGQDILMSIGGMYTAEGCLREDGDWAQFRWDTIQRKDMVGAWMPLPEPYEEEEDNDRN